MVLFLYTVDVRLSITQRARQRSLHISAMLRENIVYIQNRNVPGLLSKAAPCSSMTSYGTLSWRMALHLRHDNTQLDFVCGSSLLIRSIVTASGVICLFTPIPNKSLHLQEMHFASCSMSICLTASAVTKSSLSSCSRPRIASWLRELYTITLAQRCCLYVLQQSLHRQCFR